MASSQNSICEGTGVTRLKTAASAARVVVLTVGAITTVMLLKMVVLPSTLEVLSSGIPRLRSLLRLWLSRPLVYVILNFIIITIAASSTFQYRQTEKRSDGSTFSRGTDGGPPDAFPFQKEDHLSHSHSHDTHALMTLSEVWRDITTEHEELQEEEEKKAIWSSSILSAERVEDPSPETVPENHSPAASLVETKEKEMDDTLDATWKAIMERQGRVARHLSKSETLLVRSSKAMVEDEFGDDDEDPVAWARRELRKSETFNDRLSLRRDKSITSEELSRRADELIKKFYNEMRLQRLESKQRFLQMVNRFQYRPEEEEEEEEVISIGH